MPKNNSSYYSDNSVFYKMIMIRFYNNNYYKKDYLTWNIDLDNYKIEMYAVKNGNEVTEILTSTPIKELPILKETLFCCETSLIFEPPYHIDAVI